jgi:hypothetical protein
MLGWHLRKTDFSFQISRESYIDYVKSLGFDAEQIIFVSDDINYATKIMQDPIDRYSFLRDFFVMMNSIFF